MRTTTGNILTTACRFILATTTATGVALVMALAPSSVRAQGAEFPNRTLRMIVPYAAGGPTDLLSRLVAQKMGQGLGQTMIVENRAGGGTMIGSRAALQAPPDGYTLLMATTTTALGPLTYKDAGYQFDELTVLAPLSFEGFLLAVHSSVPAKNLTELVSLAKANPGKLNYGSLGGAGPVELLTDRFLSYANIDIVRVNYSGAGPAAKDLIAGTIQVNVAGPIGLVPPARMGSIRLLGNSSDKRTAIAPDVPTFKEQGFPTMVGGVWYAVTVPSKSPVTAKDRLMHEAQSAMAAPDLRERMNSLGVTPWAGTLQEFLTFMKSDLALFEADIKRGRVKAE